mgnify:CR=1 FL=1
MAAPSTANWTITFVPKPCNGSKPPGAQNWAQDTIC